MKQNIMLLVPMLHQGGFEKVCVTTARMLQPVFDVTIVIFDDADIAYDIAGLNLINLNLGVRKSKIGKISNVIKRSFAVRQLKKQKKVDVTYSFGATANLVNALSGGPGESWIGLRSYMDMENKKNITFLTKRADRIVCCSKVIEEEIRLDYRFQDAVTLYNPYNLRKTEELAGQIAVNLPFAIDDFVIVSMGREDDVKGFWHLIKSFHIVRKRCEKAKLLIIGDGDFQEYRKLAAQLGVTEDVCFTGLQTNPFPYLKRGNLYVLTSMFEGFPNALVEAMSLGIPVIATNCKTGPAEILTDDYAKNSIVQSYQKCEYGVLIPCLSEKKNLEAGIITEEETKLALQMLELITDISLHRHYADRAKERAAFFSEEHYLSQLTEMLS